ncbi:SGNH/GDSL hydrolase family protein [Coprobacter fastidiosus]|uniref:SGNH/GDSL hydrolase family protein n=1 Tax=Coprobacter fastidiosus TaxID=1099853 RepID=UPI00320A9996
MASEERIERLDDNGTPDVILFFGGTNDISDTELGEFHPGENIGDVSEFNSAYQTAVVRFQEYYPEAEIICLTPYYRDISSWNNTTNEDVDLYANSIIEICRYYGVRCIDLRQADIDERKDMCGWNYLHVNEKGAYRIWHMLQYNQPPLSSGMINVLQNSDNIVRAEFIAERQSENIAFQWQVYDCIKDSWIFISEWTKNNVLTYEPINSGEYWLYCTARNHIGEEVSDVTGISFTFQPTYINGVCWINKEDEIQIGVAYSNV